MVYPAVLAPKHEVIQRQDFLSFFAFFFAPGCEKSCCRDRIRCPWRFIEMHLSRAQAEKMRSPSARHEKKTADPLATHERKKTIFAQQLHERENYCAAPRSRTIAQHLGKNRAQEELRSAPATAEKKIPRTHLCHAQEIILQGKLSRNTFATHKGKYHAAPRPPPYLVSFTPGVRFLHVTTIIASGSKMDPHLDNITDASK